MNESGTMKKIAEIGYDGKREARFWAKVSRGPETDCWLWMAGKYRCGYGKFINRAAHRVSYELNFGPIPSGLLVCHRCDVRECVNPAHLFLGSHKDNCDDMHRKGRHSPPPHPRGDLHPESKLTADKVRSIRADKASYQSIAKRFGVSKSLVNHIKVGRAWAWLPQQ